MANQNYSGETSASTLVNLATPFVPETEKIESKQREINTMLNMLINDLQDLNTKLFGAGPPPAGDKKGPVPLGGVIESIHQSQIETGELIDNLCSQITRIKNL